MRTLYVNMEEIDPFSENIVEKYASSIKQAEREGIKPKVLLLVNPHNPSGTLSFLTFIKRRLNSIRPLLSQVDPHSTHEAMFIA